MSFFFPTCRASSSSSSSHFLSSSLTNPSRSVVHHARPPRRPLYPAHTDPKPKSTNPGTSKPKPRSSELDTSSSSSSSSITSTSGSGSTTILPDSGLEFHYLPPPTAPSYTTGTVPDILKWVAGSSSVGVSPQSNAPYMRPGKVAKAKEAQERLQLELGKSRKEFFGLGLSEEQVEEIRKLRAEDVSGKWSRNALIKKYNLPPTPLTAQLLSRLAPTSPERREAYHKSLERKKAGWGFNKSLAREAREVRKGFW